MNFVKLSLIPTVIGEFNSNSKSLIVSRKVTNKKRFFTCSPGKTRQKLHKFLFCYTIRPLLTASSLFKRHVSPTGLHLEQALVIVCFAVTATYGFYIIRAIFRRLADALGRTIRLLLAFRVVSACHKFTWFWKKVSRLYLSQGHMIRS